MNKTEKISLLQDLIRIHSTNGNELEVANYLQQLLSKHGIKVKVDEFGNHRANLIAEIGNGTTNQVLGLTGHMDTVAVSDSKNWQHSPFEGKVVADRIYGRGAADMKSGLAAQVITLIELADSGLIPNGKVRLIATAGEELGTPGADRLEKQGIVNDLTALIVGEPTSGNVVYAHSGCMNYEVTSIGKSCHSSHPHQGINAITGLVKFIEKEQYLFNNVPDDPYLGKVQHSITVINGGSQVNIIPDQAKLQGNIRPTVIFDNSKVTDRLNTIIKDLNATSPYHLELTIRQNYSPISTTPNDPFVQLALNAAQQSFTTNVKLATINGATDASVFTLHHPNLPVVVLGCDSWQFAHQNDEYTTISSYLATINTYKQIVDNFFKIS